ncbi:MAG TPA: DUF3592 domain-containing protein [Thermoanaerobaculia bacterium]|nr:DUF3592 domain-containing protein [Thermoanaerobaculia bacterium]
MKKVWLLVSAALVIAGAAALVFANMAARDAARANDWSQVRATVDGADASSVRYHYEAGGATQHGSNPPRPNALYDKARGILVYVNPANPAESLVDLPPRPPSWPITAGAVAILAGVMAAILSWRMPASANAKYRRTKGVGTATGTGTRRRKPQPMSRLQPPPPVKWNRGNDKDAK